MLRKDSFALSAQRIKERRQFLSPIFVICFILWKNLLFFGKSGYLCIIRHIKIGWTMMYLNQFHKEAVERKVRKIAESKKSPMSSIAAAAYMKKNFEKAKTM